MTRLAESCCCSSQSKLDIPLRDGSLPNIASEPLGDNRALAHTPSRQQETTASL